MISVTVLTKNNQKTLRKTLESLKNFDEVIILDSGSTDDTLKIAKSYPNVSIHTSPFLGFGPMHNYATKLAKHDWILSIDSDEVVTPELFEEIQSLTLDKKAVYSINRHNFFNGKRIKWCGGWYPDRVKRLYHRTSTRFSSDLVHEYIVTENLKEKPLTSPIQHTPYKEAGDFLEKMHLYTGLFAKQNTQRAGSLPQAIFHSWYAFIKSYIFKRGFLGGKEGYIISIYNAHTAFYKYLRTFLK